MEGKFILEIKCFSDNRNKFEITHTLNESKEPIVCESPMDLQYFLLGMAHTLPDLLSSGKSQIYLFNKKRWETAGNKEE